MKRTKFPNILSEEITEKHEWGLPNIVIPAEVLFHPELRHNEKILFGFIQNLSKTERGCWASNRYLGELIGVGIQSASDAISNLKNKKFILVSYHNDNGKQVRIIQINEKYTEIYAHMIQEIYSNIKGGLQKKLYTHTKKIVAPYKKNTNKYNNIINKNNNICREEKNLHDIDIVDENKENNLPIKKGTSLPIKERNKQYLPLASKLASIIQTSKNIKINATKLSSWSNEIRKLVESDGIDLPRIVSAVDWYENNIGGEYIPVIESGGSLRTKFLRLEDAMKRSGMVPKNENGKRNLSNNSEGPRTIIEKAFKGQMRDIFWKDCYRPALDLINNENGRSTRIDLAKKLIIFYCDISKRQNKNFNSELRALLPEYGPTSLIGAYIEWLRDQDWITSKKPGMFNIDYAPFRDFCNKFAYQSDSMARHPLTGSPINSE